MRELECDVRLQLLGDEALDDRLVLGSDRGGALGVRDRLAEERRVRVQAGVVEPPQHRDARVERLAGDEARRADAACRGSARGAADARALSAAWRIARIAAASRRVCAKVGHAVPSLPRRRVSSGSGRAASPRATRTGRPSSEHGAPELVRVVGEDVVGKRLLDDPRPFLELVVELARPPARVPDVDARPSKLAQLVRIDLGRKEADGLHDERARPGRARRSRRVRRPPRAAPARRRTPHPSRRRAASARARPPRRVSRTSGSARCRGRPPPSARRRAPRSARSWGRRAPGRRRAGALAATPRSYHRHMEGVDAKSVSWRDPQGFPGEDLFEVAETPIPAPAEGQVLDPQRVLLRRSLHAPADERRALVRRAVHARRGDDGRSGRKRWPSRATRATARASGCCTSSAGASGRSRTARHLAQARSERCPGLDRSRRPRHAGLHRLVRAVRPR